LLRLKENGVNQPPLSFSLLFALFLDLRIDVVSASFGLASPHDQPLSPQEIEIIACTTA
jgi:hypothetical protein